jgi:hypothetical protein
MGDERDQTEESAMIRSKPPTDEELPALKKAAAKTLAKLESINEKDLPWAATRFPLFHNKPLSVREGEAFFSIGRMGPGGRNFPHAHGFHQVRYVLEGEFIINGVTYGPGSLIDYPEFARYETYSPKGGTWFQVQFWNPKNGAGPTDFSGFTYGDEKDAEVEMK